MKITVSLRDLINEMDVLSDEHTAYLNKRTGELLTLSDEELSAVEDEVDLNDYPEWRQEMIEKAQEVLGSEDYLPLPGQFDINEYKIMEDFCYSIEDPKRSNELLQKIRGSGAFGRFKEAIRSLDMEEDWFRFREKALERIAIEWLEDNHIAYSRDTG